MKDSIREIIDAIPADGWEKGPLGMIRRRVLKRKSDQYDYQDDPKFMCECPITAIYHERFPNSRQLEQGYFTEAGAACGFNEEDADMVAAGADHSTFEMYDNLEIYPEYVEIREELERRLLSNGQNSKINKRKDDGSRGYR